MKPLVVFSVCATLCACGQLGFDELPEDASFVPGDGSVEVRVDGAVDAPSDGAVDASSDGAVDAPSDGAVDAPGDAGPDASDAGMDSGVPVGPFGAEVLIPGLTSAVSQDDPTLSADELLIVFQRGNDIWMAERASMGDPFDAPTLVAALSTGNETTPELSPDGLTLYFGRNVAGRAVDVFISTRSTRADAWGAAVPVAELSTSLWEAAATPTYEPNLLLFVRNLGAGLVHEMFLATRADADSPWVGVELDPPLNGPLVDTAPYLTERRTLYITTTRAGGDREIWRAAPNGDSWFAPEPVSELNGAFEATDPWVSRDERRIYYATDESGTAQLVVRSR